MKTRNTVKKERKGKNMKMLNIFDIRIIRIQLKLMNWIFFPLLDFLKAN